MSVSQAKEVLRYLEQIEQYPKQQDTIKYTKEEIRHIFKKLEEVFVFYENWENKQVLENILRKTSPVYTGTRRSQKVKENNAPFMMHFINVSTNTKKLYELLRNSKHKALEIQIETWFKELDFKTEEQKQFFLTTISLLHDLVEDFYKQANKKNIQCKELQNCSKNLINLAEQNNQTEFLNEVLKQLWIESELKKVFNDKQIEAIKTALNDLNMVGGLEFNKQTKEIKNPNKLINYFNKIWEHPFSIFIKTADLLDNTHGHITDKQLLKYTMYAIIMGYKNANFLTLMKAYLKDFEYIESSQLNNFIAKAEIASKFLKYYKEKEKQIWFINIKNIDFEKKFLNNLAHFVAYNDKKKLKEKKQEIIAAINETYSELLEKYGLNINNKNVKHIYDIAKSKDKLLLNIAFINIFYLFSLLKRQNRLSIFTEENKPQLSEIQERTIENWIKKIENEATLKNLFSFFAANNFYLFSLILSTDHQIKAREKWFSSITWKLIREANRWKNAETKWSLWDHYAYAIIFDNIDDAKDIAEELKNLWEAYQVEYSDRWLLKSSESDELTTIDVPFCNFKIWYKWTYLFELSIRVNPTNFVENTIKNKNIQKEKEIKQLIINAFEPIEHSLYKAVEDVLTIPYLKENFFTEKNILNYNDKNQFENIINNIFSFYFRKIVNYLKANPDDVELIDKYFSWIRQKTDTNYNKNITDLENIVKEIFLYKLIKLACKKIKNNNSDFLGNIIKYSKIKLETDYKKNLPDDICSKYSY